MLKEAMEEKQVIIPSEIKIYTIDGTTSGSVKAVSADDLIRWLLLSASVALEGGMVEGGAVLEAAADQLIEMIK